ncbi:MAG: hypothetical protein QOH47_2186 [Sphingomonadales bacterium]|jgi:hypothetical protein|nr:hypothetical protein [Sphingomonadales bacterium]
MMKTCHGLTMRAYKPVYSCPERAFATPHKPHKASKVARRQSQSKYRLSERAACRAVFGAMEDKLYDTPSEVTAKDGKVVVDGPDAVDVSLTPEAALETSQRLLHGGLKARGQQIAADRRKPITH